MYLSRVCGLQVDFQNCAFRENVVRTLILSLEKFRCWEFPQFQQSVEKRGNNAQDVELMVHFGHIHLQI